MTNRRTFIGNFAGALLAAAVPVRAQSPRIPVIGYLSTGKSGPSQVLDAVRQGLKDTGYVEGTNYMIEPRFADDLYERLPSLAADLVNLRVAVLVTFGGGVSARAAKAATSTIPIVFMGVGNPVPSGLGESIARPGGNATGVGISAIEVAAKRIQILHDLVPKATTIALLVNPDNAGSEGEEREAQVATRALAQQLHVLRARNEQDIEAAFATLGRLQCDALVVASDAFFSNQGKRIARLAARYAIPAIYEGRWMVEDGGLMSYGTDVFEMYRQAGIYVGKILKGEKPGDLPVLQPKKFDLVINSRTARALGLTIPPVLRVQAEFIE